VSNYSSTTLYRGSNPGNSTSFTVTGLPVDGETIFVILTDAIGNQTYGPPRYTYTAATDIAAITSPAQGTQLAGSTETFSWTTGTGATGYALWVGTTGMGSHNLYEGGYHTGTSLTVTGLPTNGEAVYVRLTTNLGYTTEYFDYVYTAAD
jgi:hypothetical protein